MPPPQTPPPMVRGTPPPHTSPLTRGAATQTFAPGGKNPSAATAGSVHKTAAEAQIPFVCAVENTGLSTRRSTGRTSGIADQLVIRLDFD